MSAWLKRFGLHLAAAVGATGIFVAAAAVGASQTRQQVAVSPPLVLPTRTTPARPKPTVVAMTPTATPAADTAASATSTTPTDVAQTPALANQPAAAPTASPTAAPAVTGPAAAATTPAQSTPRRNATQTRPQPQPTPEPPIEQPAEEPASPPVRTDAQQPATPVRPPSKPQQGGAPAPTPTARPAAPEKVAPERSLAGTIKAATPNSLEVVGVGGREWHVEPAPGALIRLNGKTVKLDVLQVGDSVVILGQAQPGPGARFLAHAITAKSK